jgi:hypothetical protein
MENAFWILIRKKKFTKTRFGTTIPKILLACLWQRCHDLSEAKSRSTEKPEERNSSGRRVIVAAYAPKH